MKITVARIFFLIAALWISVEGYYYLLLYAAALWSGVEFFTWIEKPNYQKNLRHFRLLAVIYLYFVVADRIYKHYLNHEWAKGFNIFEHLGFVIFGMYIMKFVLDIFIPQLSRFWMLFIIFFASNAMGLVNELYQNFIHRSLFHFTSDSVKDILVNFIASILFVLVYILRPKRVQ
jgi:hypothetical protein